MAQSDVPFSQDRTGSLPRLSNLPLRVQTILVAAAVFLITGSAIVLATSFLVNRLKNQMVVMTRSEVQAMAEETSREIARQVEMQGATSLAEVAESPEVRAQLRIMSKEGGVVLAAMIGTDGKCYMASDEEKLDTCSERNAHELKGFVPDADGMTWEMKLKDLPGDAAEEKIAITAGGQTIGFLGYGVREADVIAAKLDPISRHISSSLTLMSALVILCIGLSIVALYAVGNRHVALEKRHAERQHLANIGTMASGLAHEIRNPLHAMNLHLEAAREELELPRAESPEQAARIIGTVQKQIESLSSILTNFMSYAVPKQVEKEPLRLKALATEVITLVEPELAARGVTFNRSVPEDAWIQGDPTGVRQVLLNVLINATQAVEKSPRRQVDLRVERTGHNGWAVVVDDTGPGLPAGEEQTIFDVFVSHRKGGSGFGLAIARRIMEQHGGSIIGETRPEGGARFTMLFQATTQPTNFEEITHGAPVHSEKAAIG